MTLISVPALDTTGMRSISSFFSAVTNASGVEAMQASSSTKSSTEGRAVRASRTDCSKTRERESEVRARRSVRRVVEGPVLPRLEPDLKNCSIKCDACKIDLVEL
jgi:hypothetical protein